MNFSIEEYIDSKGNSPVSKWLETLEAKTQARIDARIARFEKGNFGDSKNLGGGLFEARFFIGPGYRLYFAKLEKRVVLLLHGGDKSSQSRDINKAQEYLSDFRRRQDGNEKS